MTDSLLSRARPSLIQVSTPLQSQVDGLVGGFAEQATDWRSLAAMMAGGVAYRAGRIGVMGIGGGNAVRALSVGVGLSAEVSAFELSHRGLLSMTGASHGGPQANLWRWAGEGGIRQGLLNSFVTFGTLKGAGHFAQGQNVVLQHLIQDTGMVLGHQVTGALGLAPRPTGTLAEQFLHAEATNLQLAGGMALGQAFTGGRIQAMERGMDLALSSAPRPASPNTPEILRPALAMATAGNGGEGPRIEVSRPRPELSTHVEMSSIEGGDGPRVSMPPRERGPRLTPSSFLPTPPLGALEGKVVLIANRGEAATRAARTAQRLGLKTVVLVSEPDRGSLHANLPGVHPIVIGGERIVQSYHDDAKVQAAIARTAQELGVHPNEVLVWPGWGGRAEDPGFVTAIEGAKARFVGPRAFAMGLLGPKTSANEVAEAAGARPIPSSRAIGEIGKNESADQASALNEGLQAYDQISEGGNVAVLFKGVGTGGGKGMREVPPGSTREQITSLFQEARDEALATSGDPRLFVARLIRNPRHMEGQFFSDGYGNVRLLGIRECSLQRGSQKAQERDITALLTSAAREVFLERGSAILGEVRQRDPGKQGYVGAITLEFLYDTEGLATENPFGGDFKERLFFMEANTRLQVEHSVTEEAVRLTRGTHLQRLDAVELQLRLASGEAIPFRQEDLSWPFIAVEARVNAEDPYNNFQPSPGRVTRFRYPDTELMRVDTGIEENRAISEFYDSMIAKVMAAQPVPEGEITPDIARELHIAVNSRLDHFLSHMEVAGVRTNVPFHIALLRTPQVRSGEGYHTKFIENEFLASSAGRRTYQDWDMALLTSAVATYAARREKAIQALRPGQELPNLARVEMEIGGHEFKFEVRERGPGDYGVRLNEQKVDLVVETPETYSAEFSGQKIEIKEGRPGHFFAEVNGVRQRVKLIHEGPDRFKAVIEDQSVSEKVPAHLETLGRYSTALNGARVEVQRKSPGQYVTGALGREIDIRESGPGHWAALNLPSVTVELDRAGPIYTLNIGGTTHRTVVDSQLGKRFVRVGDAEYEVNVAGEGILDKEHVITNVPGKVVTPPNEMPQVGQIVREGQELFKSEAMKSRNPVRARMDGRIAEVRVKSGDLIQPNVSLVRIEPSEGNGAVERPHLPPIHHFAFDPLVALLANPSPQERASMIQERAGLQEMKAVLDFFRRAALGFDLPPEVLNRGVEVIRSVVSKGDAERQALVEGLRGIHNEQKKGFEGGVFDTFSTLQRLFHPAFGDQFNSYLNRRFEGGDPSNADFAQALREALALYRVTDLAPTPALHETLYRMARARQNLPELRQGLAALIELSRDLGLAETASSLQNLQRSILETPAKDQIPLANLAQEAVSSFETADPTREFWSRRFERLFHSALQGHKRRKQEARLELETAPYSTERYLLQRVGSTKRNERELATALTFRRLYGPKHQNLRFEGIGNNIFLGTFEDNRGSLPQRRAVAWVTAGSVQEVPAAIRRARKALAQQDLGTTEDVIEVMIPTPMNRPIDNTQLESAVQEVMGTGNGVKRITIGSASGTRAELAAPKYRTFRPNGPKGEFIHDGLFEDIHPMAGWRIELDRWHENFSLSRLPSLFPEVFVLRAEPRKGKGGAQNLGSQNLVIAQVSGDLQYLRFGADLPARLQQIYERLQTEPQTPLTEEDLVAWRAVPWGLKLAGQVPQNTNPFTIGVMEGSPRDLIPDFNLDIPRVLQAGEALVNKIYSIPEAERQALNAATSLKRLQATTPKGPLDARADIFIRPLLELDDNEASYIIARSVRHFSDPRLDKTVLHFTRPGGHAGRYEDTIAVIRTPGRARLDIKIEPVTDRRPHRVLDDVKRKRLAAQAAGSLYAYDRANLTRDVLEHEIWPAGTAPEDALKIRELVLGSNGQLKPTDREPGKNNVGMIAFETSIKLPADPQGHSSHEHRMIYVANDYRLNTATIKAGTLATEEAAVYEAAFERALSEGIPIHYFSESGGARTGFPVPIFRALRRTQREVERQDGTREKEWIFWVTESDLDRMIGDPDRKITRPLRELVIPGEAVTVDGVEGFQIRTVLGKAFFENTESLTGSERTARITSLASREIPVMASAHGVTIGIGTYDWVLPVLTQIVESAAAALTGPRSVNASVATAYTSAHDYAGARILAESGLAYLKPADERANIENLLRLLSYLPIRRGERSPVVDTGDPIDRDVGEDLARLIPGKAQPFDMRPVLNTVLDRGFQGGLFEVARDWGPSVITGFGRLGGEAVAIIAPQPKPDAPPEGSGRGPFFGSTLDRESAEKFAEFVELANRLGMPLLMDPAFAGFMPDAPNVRGRVYNGGRRMVNALATYEHPILMWAHPYFEWWGGAVAVTGKQINPDHMQIFADHRGAMGILGVQGAMEVSLVSREVEAMVGQDPRIVELNDRIQHAETRQDQVRLAQELKNLTEELKRGEYAAIIRDFWPLINTPERAQAVGSIDEVIWDSGRSRQILIDGLRRKRTEIEEKRASEAAYRAARDQVVSLATLFNLPYQVLPNGDIELTINRVAIRSDPRALAEGIQGMARTILPQIQMGDLSRLGELIAAAQTPKKE